MNESNEIINKISDFVENIRIGMSKQGTPSDTRRDAASHRHSSGDNRDGRDNHQRNSQGGRGKHEDTPRPSTSGREEAEKIIIDAEQLKSKVLHPKGKEFNFECFLHNIDDDDEFFHITCHINPTLRNKIAKGEFIDLEVIAERQNS